MQFIRKQLPFLNKTIYCILLFRRSARIFIQPWRKRADFPTPAKPNKPKPSKYSVPGTGRSCGSSGVTTRLIS